MRETFWQYDLKYVNELKTCIRENRVRLLDAHEKVLRKQMPDRVIRIYSAYLEQAVDMAKHGQIAGVGIAHRGDTKYLKSIPDGSENNNLGNLPSVSPDAQG